MSTSAVKWPIIIGGCYRSGTTLLRRLLDSHSQIHCGPEVKFFADFYGQYLNDDLAHVRFFRTARSLGLEESEMLSLFGGAFVAAHELAAEKRGKTRWADKVPENVLYMQRWDELLAGRLHFVHVVRSPLDILASLLETKFKRAIPEGFEDKVEVVRSYMQAGSDYAAARPDRSATVHYEQLVTDPAAVLQALLEPTGEEFEPSMLSSFAEAERGRGVEDPKARTATSIHAESVGRWTAELTPKQVRLAKKGLGDLPAMLGYSLPEAHAVKPRPLFERIARRS